MLFEPYLNQNFNELKQNCLSQKSLFKDDKFLPEDKSLKRTGNLTPDDGKIYWKRPHEIVKKPKFLTTTAINPTHLSQGCLGNCWVISGIVSLLRVPQYSAIIIPQEEQSFDENSYAGIFKC